MRKGINTTLAIFCFFLFGCSPNKSQEPPKKGPKDRAGNNTLVNGFEIPPDINELQSVSGVFVRAKPIDHFEIPEENWANVFQTLKEAKRSSRVEVGHKPEVLLEIKYKMKNGQKGTVRVFNLEMDKPFVFTVYDLDVWSNFEHPEMTLQEFSEKLKPFIKR